MPEMPRVLLIDDSSLVRGAVRRRLEAEGLSVREASTGAQGLRLARREPPDLLVTDWVLGPGLSGVSLCASLKSRLETRSIPIIVMTAARVEFEDELRALEAGADLYLTKEAILPGRGRPERFLGYLRSLLARRERLRRLGARPEVRPVLRLDLRRHLLRTPYGPVEDLSTTLFTLLALLARRSPRPASRRLLLRSLWGDSVRDRTLDQAVCRLKGRLERRQDEFIECIRGRGYRLKVPASLSDGPAAAGRPVTNLTPPMEKPRDSRQKTY